MRVSRILSPGHPDRACDIIAESIVDEYVRRDPETAIRVRVSGGRGALFVSGIVSSKADFDVGAVITRAAASLGVRGHIEPFVSIEVVPGSFILEATRANRPISVVGYATSETEERIPAHVLTSRRIAKRLEDSRQHNPEWFWLEPAYEVVTCERQDGTKHVYVSCAHGEQELQVARERITNEISRVDSKAIAHVNEHGPVPSNGLDQDIGASGCSDEPYGSSVLVPESPIGLSPSNPAKFGTWLARGLALRALERSGAKAVMVQATYMPGGAEPSSLRVRDEKGNDASQPDDAATITFVHLKPHLRPALSTNAAHWGYVGEVEMPWEQ